jgi:hypothetical protein
MFFALLDVASVSPASRAALAAVAPDLATTRRWLEQVGNQHASEDTLALAGALAGADEGVFGDLLAALEKNASGEARAAAVRALIAAQPEARSSLQRAVLDGRFEAITRTVQLLKAAKRDAPPFVEPAETEAPWIARYPEPLRPALRRLDAMGPDAQERAARALGAAFRNTSALEREIAVLRSKIAGGDTRLEHRLRRRVELLEHAPTPSPTRLALLAGRLELVVTRARFDRWLADSEHVVRERLSNALRLPALPRSSGGEHRALTLLMLLELEPTFRALARSVLKSRLGPPPWDLRDHPANAAYLDRLRGAGIRVEPWLDGLGVRTVRVPGEGDVTYGLEEDPLEVLEMGRPFGTCLAPGSFNFFSAVVNAADINKRVIVFRNADRRMVARCLLALDRSGGIVSFRVYHHGTFDFTKVVSEFVVELAERMGTVILQSGHIPVLTANDWYDDGSIDVGGRLPCLAEGSSLRQKLGVVSAEEVVDLIERALAPLPLNELTLPLLLELPEILDRPPLLSALLLRVPDGALPDEAWIRLASRLLRSGNLDELPDPVADRLFALAERSLRRRRWLPDEIATALPQIDPSRALRLLRETRGSGVRRLEDETDGVRVLLAAEALLALGRRKQVAALMTRRLRARDPNSDWCRERLRRLKRAALSSPSRARR